jgi:glyoxylase-like metal-dependent hydrolase (beta-lactamase superfamily II)
MNKTSTARRLVAALALHAMLALGAASLLWWTLASSARADAPAASSTTVGPTRTPLAWPAARPPQGMSLHALLTGRMYSRAGLAYEGGALGEERIFGQGAILIRHPAGHLLFDSGFGEQVDDHFRSTPWLMRATTRYEKLPSARSQLAKAGLRSEQLKAIVLTHAHWDHVSGLGDLPGVPVWTTREERGFIASGDESTALARQLGARRYQAIEFKDGPYLGFGTSLDVFGDGSVVLVPAPGHTPGSLIAFVHTPDGQHRALVGDLVWQIEGIDQQVPKPWIARRLVDHDADTTLAMIRKVHDLRARLPGLVIVPAHDHRVWLTLPGL